jgi:AbrB family looped-hinge helix DNA binding protein
MKKVVKEASAQFSVKGQIVIPAHLRKEYEIEPGTRATVTATADGILIQPVTAKYVRSLRGVLKLKPGEKSALQELRELRAEERRRERR